jgi:hypothetical protein
MKVRCVLFAGIWMAIGSVPLLAKDLMAQPQPAAQVVNRAEETRTTSIPEKTSQNAVTEAKRDGLNWAQIGTGVSAAIGNLFYIPAKVAYGTLGGVAGGTAYVFTRGDHQTAHRIWRNSLGGDYVLTPKMLMGQEPIHFMGSADNNSPESIAGEPTRKNPSSGWVNAPQIVTVKIPAKTLYPAVSSSRPINAERGLSATLELRQQSAPQSKRLEKDDSVTRSVAGTSGLESVPQMSIEPQ